MIPVHERANVVRGSTVLITGGARGMGELYARRAAAAGASRIALWDLDLDLATKVAAELHRDGLEVQAFGVNVASLDEVRAGAQQVRERLGGVDVLINNAGFVRGGPFWEHESERDIEGTMAVNTVGPMWLTRELLPAMMVDRSREKRILNVSSAAGTLPNPNMSVYAASKWAMIGWSDSLRLELQREGYRHVRVTTFCPSYISTGMFEGARGPLLTPIMKPETAVNAAWNGMVAGAPFVNKPWTVKLAMALRGVLPVAAWDVVSTLR